MSLDNDYGAYLSRMIATTEAELKELQENLEKKKESVKRLSQLIKAKQEGIIDLAKEKEDFINFQKGKKDGEESSDDRKD